MEPITTTAIASLVYYLGKTMFKKSFETTVQELTKDGLKWFKSVFYKEDDKPRDVLEDLKANPENKHNIHAAELAISKALENDPKAQSYIDEMYVKVKEKEQTGEFKNIFNAQNVNTGHVETGGGDFIQGRDIIKKVGGNHISDIHAGESVHIKINQDNFESKKADNSQQ